MARKIKHITTFTCQKCGTTSEDVTKNPRAWDGWNFGDGKQTCPCCVNAVVPVELIKKKNEQGELTLYYVYK